MPVRYANFLGVSPGAGRIWANRGTSGIDGSNGTAVGHVLSSNQLSLLLTGDLSFLYDRNAFFHNENLSHMRIIVFNNFGGAIFNLISGPETFNQLEKNKFLVSSHSKDLKHNALDIGFKYQKCNKSVELNTSLKNFFEPSDKGKLLEIQTAIDKQTSFKTLKKSSMSTNSFNWTSIKITDIKFDFFDGIAKSLSIDLKYIMPFDQKRTEMLEAIDIAREKRYKCGCFDWNWR